MNEKVDLKVDFCSYEAAKYACLHWHYSKTIPKNKSNYIGVWENKKFIGVVIYGLGASPSLGKPYGLTMFECCELTRIALTEHISPVSEIIPKTIKKMKYNSKGVRLIISFADPYQKHHGGIYQAGNWIYSGKSSSSIMYYDNIKKELIHPRRFGGGFCSKKKAPEYLKKIEVPGKHRYLYPLDRKMRKQIEPLRKPYPKKILCESSFEGEMPDFQSGGAGSTPATRSNLSEVKNG